MSTAARLRGLKRGVVAFAPTDIAGIIAWLDFSDTTKLYTDAGTTLVSADGDAIYQVNDKGGIGNHLTQATAANRPLYKTAIQNGLSIARYDSTDYVDKAALVGGDLSQPTTLCVVGKITTSGGAVANSFFDSVHATKRQVLYRAGGGGTTNIYSGSAVADGSSDTNWHIFAAIFNGASSKLYVGGGSGTSGSAGTSVLTGIRLGMGSAGTAPLLGDLGDVLLYNSALSVANLNALGSYFNTKWGITWTTAS